MTPEEEASDGQDQLSLHQTEISYSAVSLVMVDSLELRIFIAVSDRTTWGTSLAVFGFGLGLFYGVQYFLKVVEDNLSADTKLEIAFWLLDLHPSKEVERWPSTLVKLFQRLFGEKQLSLKCLWWSCVASAITSTVILAGLFILNFDWIIAHGSYNGWWAESGVMKLFFFYLSTALIINLIPDYISLWKTRALLHYSVAHPNISVQIVSFVVDLFLSLLLAAFATLYIGSIALMILFGVFGYSGDEEFWQGALNEGAALSIFLVFLPACFGRLWLLLYLLSGLILKFSRKLDVGFNWFNSRFDIEHRPLQCVGLVAGSIVALSYWIIAVITLAAANFHAKGS